VGTVLRVGPLLGPIDVIDGRTFSDDTYLAATVAQNIGWGRGPLYGDEPTNGYQPLHVLLAATTWTGDDAAVRAALDRVVTDAADPTVNLMPALIGAVDNRVTGGEIVEALEGVFGTYTETAVV
jgi:hypothetical protein